MYVEINFFRFLRGQSIDEYYIFLPQLITIIKNLQILVKFDMSNNITTYLRIYFSNKKLVKKG